MSNVNIEALLQKLNDMEVKQLTLETTQKTMEQQILQLHSALSRQTTENNNIKTDIRKLSISASRPR